MEQVKTITIPYKPRPIWVKTIHPALDKYRFAVMVCHRRFGKTVGVINHLIKKAIEEDKPAPQYAYIAPYRNQAKKIAWNYLKYYTSFIVGSKPNESELFVELPSKNKGWAGARIYIIGADNPDVLRGTYWDGVVLDEFAQIKPELYGGIVRPALADRKGFAWFIGTPKGQNQFYEKYKEALNAPQKWFCCLYRVDETGVLPEEEIKDMLSEMTDIEARQELYCDFTASASNVLITIDEVTKACNRKTDEEKLRGLPLIMAVDVARFGDDRTTIWKRKGQGLYNPIVLQKMDNMEIASRLAYEIDTNSPQAVFIDVGAVGSGVIDRLHQLGYQQVIEVNFASAADSPLRYANKRSEMYCRAKKWITEVGCLVDNPDLKTELTSIEYKFDKSGRIILEPKEKVKEKLGKSPDLADGFVLTFAYKVIGTEQQKILGRRAKIICNTDYNPLLNI